MTVDLLWTQQIAAALAEYAYRHKHATSLQPASSVLSYSSEFVLPNGQRRHVGGYADRLKGLLSTALLAMLSERRFVAEWLTPHPISRILAPNMLDWERMLDPAPSSAAQATIVDGIDDAAHALVKAQLLDRPDIFDRLRVHERAIKIHSNINFCRDLLANQSLMECTRVGRLLASGISAIGVEAVAAWLPGTLFHYLFHYVPHGVALNAWLRFLHVRQSRPLVGVQFRTGGGGAWLDPTLDSLASVDRLVAASVAQAERLRSPVFFLSSDSAAAVAAIAGTLQPRFEVLHFDFPPAHFERSAHSDPLLQTEAPVLEHMCLAHCDIVVHGRGGFGVTAAAIGGIPAVPYTG